MPMPRLKQAAACMLVELGNGDKFIFDLGTGSMERLYALGIPLDFIDKIFLTHLHTDHMLEMWAWMTGTLAGTIDTRSMSLEVTKYDWSKVNGVIYKDNGVVIRSIPAVHFEQSASFILEWNRLKLAFSGDTLPSKWWIEHTQGVDLSIHESIFMPDMAMSKWKFSEMEALNAMTTIHLNPAFFAKVTAMTRPKHAVAYHFQNDFDTLPAIIRTVEQVYDGPVDYARDFMVWNVTKDGVRTRTAVPNPEYYPTPPPREKQIFADFNEKNGTDYRFKLNTEWRKSVTDQQTTRERRQTNSDCRALLLDGKGRKVPMGTGPRTPHSARCIRHNVPRRFMDHLPANLIYSPVLRRSDAKTARDPRRANEDQPCGV